MVSFIFIGGFRFDACCIPNNDRRAIRYAKVKMAWCRSIVTEFSKQLAKHIFPKKYDDYPAIENMWFNRKLSLPIVTLVDVLLKSDNTFYAYLKYMYDNLL